MPCIRNSVKCIKKMIPVGVVRADTAQERQGNNYINNMFTNLLKKKKKKNLKKLKHVETLRNTTIK